MQPGGPSGELVAPAETAARIRSLLESLTADGVSVSVATLAACSLDQAMTRVQRLRHGPTPEPRYSVALTTLLKRCTRDALVTAGLRSAQPRRRVVRRPPAGLESPAYRVGVPVQLSPAAHRGAAALHVPVLAGERPDPDHALLCTLPFKDQPIVISTLEDNVVDPNVTFTGGPFILNDPDRRKEITIVFPAPPNGGLRELLIRAVVGSEVRTAKVTVKSSYAACWGLHVHAQQPQNRWNRP